MHISLWKINEYFIYVYVSTFMSFPDKCWASLATVKSPDELVYRSEPDAAVAPWRYGLDPLLPTPGHHSMLGIRGDILDVTTPLVGGCAALPFRSIHS